MNYTPAQTRWFLAAIDDLALEDHRTDVQGQRVAQATDGKLVAAYLKGEPLAAAAQQTSRRVRKE